MNFDKTTRSWLDADMASEATTMAVRGNVLMDTRVIKVAGFKYEVKLSPRLF